MKNFSILALVAATMAFTSEANKLQTVHEGVANAVDREDEDWPICDADKEDCSQLAQIIYRPDKPARTMIPPSERSEVIEEDEEDLDDEE